jgi:hypothetical protein
MNAKELLHLGVMMAAAAGSGLATAATTTSANGPICDTAATAETAYSCYGSDYKAVYISNRSCGEWLHRGMLVGSRYYQYYGGCANKCTSDSTSCNGGAGNYYVVRGTDGWDFRQFYVNSTASSYSKTCDGCALGMVGASGSATSGKVYSDNRQYGTRSSAWYTGVIPTCGGSGYCGNLIGYPTL